MLSRKPAVPEDLRGIDAALRELRPELPDDRMRSIGVRARNRARVSAARSTHSKEPSLRSRIAIITTLVLGFAFSGAGVGLAVTGVGSQNTSPADQQYDRPANNSGNPTLAPTQETPAPANEVEGESDEGTTPGVAGDSDDQGGNAVAGAEDTQETRQLAVEAGGEELPFTGFAAIPVLLMGLALLTAGFMLRRRSTGDSL
jgi:hypothetical protein